MGENASILAHSSTPPRRTVQLRLRVLGLITVCLLTACGDSNADDATNASTTMPAPSSASSAPTTIAAPSKGNYNVTPLRHDDQRVTFRVTLADGVTGEVSLTPADTAIESVGPWVELMRPGNVITGGGDIFTTRFDDTIFASFCASALGGKCTPRSTEPLADGNQFETYDLAAGGTIGRVVFGPWAILVKDRETADAFTFRGGPDGFPLVSPRATGWSTGTPTLTIYASRSTRYVLRSDPSGNCSPNAGSRVQCDRGLSVEPVATSPDASVRRVN
jgi:hypothetical protein